MRFRSAAKLERKIEHHRDRGRRTAPIIPNLRPFLEDISTLEDPGLNTPLDAPGFPRFQTATGAAIRSALLKVLKRAEIELWSNLFSNGRKSAITNLHQDGHDVVDVQKPRTSRPLTKKSGRRGTRTNSPNTGKSGIEQEPGAQVGTVRNRGPLRRGPKR
jgi:hypothetical protein